MQSGVCLSITESDASLCPPSFHLKKEAWHSESFWNKEWIFTGAFLWSNYSSPYFYHGIFCSVKFKYSCSSILVFVLTGMLSFIFYPRSVPWSWSWPISGGKCKMAPQPTSQSWIAWMAYLNEWEQWHRTCKWMLFFSTKPPYMLSWWIGTCDRMSSIPLFII